MHALFRKTEWSRSSAMDTSRGVLLQALDEWYLLGQANSSWDPIYQCEWSQIPQEISARGELVGLLTSATVCTDVASPYITAHL